MLAFCFLMVEDNHKNIGISICGSYLVHFASFESANKNKINKTTPLVENLILIEEYFI